LKHLEIIRNATRAYLTVSPNSKDITGASNGSSLLRNTKVMAEIDKR
jgi:hypothetical protein